MSKKNGLSGKIEKENIPGSRLETQVEKVCSPERPAKIKQKHCVMDLRIHSPASLGYLAIEGIDTAPALVRLAQVKGLNMIAVTDFYSGAFVDRIVAASQNSSVAVIPGVVIRTTLEGCDDVVLICLFPVSFTSSQIEEFLRVLRVPAHAAGDRRYLVKLPFDQVLKEIESRGGLVVPSRMDKTPHRLAAIKSLVEKYGFRAFDLAYSDSTRFFKQHWPKIKFQLFSFSSAHALAQVGSRVARIKMGEQGFNGIKPIIERSASN